MIKMKKSKFLLTIVGLFLLGSKYGAKKMEAKLYRKVSNEIDKMKQYLTNCDDEDTEAADVQNDNDDAYALKFDENGTPRIDFSSSNTFFDTISNAHVTFDDLEKILGSKEVSDNE